MLNAIINFFESGTCKRSDANLALSDDTAVFEVFNHKLVGVQSIDGRGLYGLTAEEFDPIEIVHAFSWIQEDLANW